MVEHARRQAQSHVPSRTDGLAVPIWASQAEHQAAHAIIASLFSPYVRKSALAGAGSM